MSKFSFGFEALRDDELVVGEESSRMELRNAEIILELADQEMELEDDKELQLDILKFTRIAIVASAPDQLATLLPHVQEGLEEVGIDVTSKETILTGIDELVSQTEELTIGGIVAISLLFSAAIGTLAIWLEELARTTNSIYKELQADKREFKAKSFPLSVKDATKSGSLLTDNKVWVKQMKSMITIGKTLSKFDADTTIDTAVVVKSITDLGVKWNGKKFSASDPFKHIVQSPRKAGWEDNKKILQAFDLVIEFANVFIGITNAVKSAKAKKKEVAKGDKKALGQAIKTLKRCYKFLFVSFKHASDDIMGMAADRMDPPKQNTSTDE